MEYLVLLKNPFLKLDTVAQLARQASPVWGGGLPLAGNTWFNSRAALTMPSAPQPLGLAPQTTLRSPTYETTAYALFLLSGRGGTTTDYYRLDTQTLVYETPIKWAYWEPGASGNSLDVTVEQLKAICPPARMTDLNRHVNHLNDTMRKYEITTRLRQVHFLSQLAHESAHFAKTLEGASGKAYEGRVKNLGNTQPGDGPRFKGRGLIQLTGRDAYTRYGHYIGRNLTNGDNMKLVEQEPYASDCAGWFWLKYKAYAHLNRLADADNFVAVTLGINGGRNGIAQREVFYKNAKRVLGLGASAPTL